MYSKAYIYEFVVCRIQRLGQILLTSDVLISIEQAPNIEGTCIS